jgi:hypothetical protein
MAIRVPEKRLRHLADAEVAGVGGLKRVPEDRTVPGRVSISQFPALQSLSLREAARWLPDSTPRRGGRYTPALRSPWGRAGRWTRSRSRSSAPVIRHRAGPPPRQPPRLGVRPARRTLADRRRRRRLVVALRRRGPQHHPGVPGPAAITTGHPASCHECLPQSRPHTGAARSTRAGACWPGPGGGMVGVLAYRTGRRVHTSSRRHIPRTRENPCAGPTPCRCC